MLIFIRVGFSIRVSVFHLDVPVQVDLVEGAVPAGVADYLGVLVLNVAVQGLLRVALKLVKCRLNISCQEIGMQKQIPYSWCFHKHRTIIMKCRH